jgi:hypothetical protein
MLTFIRMVVKLDEPDQLLSDDFLQPPCAARSDYC